jgi:hypothetical protein
VTPSSQARVGRVDRPLRKRLERGVFVATPRLGGAAMGTNALFHRNVQQTWSIDGTGRVRNVLD